MEIYNAITFKVTDATAHNSDVDEMVAMDLGTDHIPSHLLCHAHLALMFKIYSAFLVNATTPHGLVVEQYIDCVVRLISDDFNHKSWNCSMNFSLFLEEEMNKAKECFNRFVYLAAVVLHHQKQVQAFLQKYETITNTLACIVRAFEEWEFLSVLLITPAIIGVNLIEPYLPVTYFDPVNYEQLIPIMRQLYEDLKTTVVAVGHLVTSIQVYRCRSI